MHLRVEVLYWRLKLPSDDFLEQRRKKLPGEFGENRNIITNALEYDIKAFDKLAAEFEPDVVKGYLMAMVDVWDVLDHILTSQHKGFNFVETPARVRTRTTKFNNHLEEFLKFAFSEKMNLDDDHFSKQVQVPKP